MMEASDGLEETLDEEEPIPERADPRFLKVRTMSVLVPDWGHVRDRRGQAKYSCRVQLSALSSVP